MRQQTIEGTTVDAIDAGRIECVLPTKAIVGESPVWHAAERRLYWIDIQGRQIHRFDPATRVNESFDLPEIVTCIQLRRAGGLVLTLRKQFALYDPATGVLDRLSSVEPDLPGNRLNDGKCDPQGRLWAGTMDAKNWKAPSGHLFRLDPDRTVHTIRSHIVCGNGSGWSPDGRTLYHTESFRYAIFAYDFDPATGDLANRRPFVTVDEHGGGFPDGMTVDVDGFVWSNIVGLGQIRRFDPHGRLERVLQLPVPRATDCTFGGNTFDTLFVTTARETMTPGQIADAPLSGSLFAVRCDITGLPTTAFKG